MNEPKNLLLIESDRWITQLLLEKKRKTFKSLAVPVNLPKKIRNFFHLIRCLGVDYYTYCWASRLSLVYKPDLSNPLSTHPYIAHQLSAYLMARSEALLQQPAIGLTDKEKNKLTEIQTLSKVTHERITESSSAPEILSKPDQYNLSRPIHSEETPMVSVISLSYNKKPFIQETLRTVSCQSFKDYEVIMLDGNSRDGSIELLKKYDWLKLTVEPDLGFYDAFSKASLLVRGKYVMFALVTDGYLDTDWIKKSVDYLEKNPEVSLTWGFCRYLSEEGKPGAISYPEFHLSMPPDKDEFFYYWLHNGFIFPEHNLCIRHEVLRKVMPDRHETLTNPRMKTEQLATFYHRFHAQGYLCSFLPSIASFGRIHADQGTLDPDIAQSMQKHSTRYIFMRLRHALFILLFSKTFKKPSGNAAQIHLSRKKAINSLFILILNILPPRFFHFFRRIRLILM